MIPDVWKRKSILQLTVSLTPRFTAVLWLLSETGNRLNGFQPDPLLITALKRGVNDTNLLLLRTPNRDRLTGNRDRRCRRSCRGRRLPRYWIGRPNLSHHRVDRFLDVANKRTWIHSNPQRHDHQRQHVSPFAPVQIRQQFVLFVFNLAKEHSLIQPEHVSRVQDNSQPSPTCPNRIRFERTSHRQKL